MREREERERAQNWKHYLAEFRKRNSPQAFKAGYIKNQISN